MIFVLMDASFILGSAAPLERHAAALLLDMADQAELKEAKREIREY